MGKISWILLFSFCLLIATGCSQTDSNVSKKHAKPTDIMHRDYVHTFHNAQGQTFHIIDGYKRVYQYAKKEKKDPNQANDLWFKNVIKPSWNQCFSNSTYLEGVRSFINFQPEAINENLTYQSKALAHENLEKEAEEALKKASNAFPGPTTNVCVFPFATSQKWNPGETIGAGRILLFTVPKTKKQVFQGTVAHEYYHSTWMNKDQKNKASNLLGSIISEGRAMYFQSQIYPNSFKDPISIRSEQKDWKDVRKDLNSTDAASNDNVMFGIVGYHIMKQYVKNHPGATIEDWSKISPEQLYKESGYEKWLYHSQKHQ